jgi:hypothetical protein
VSLELRVGAAVGAEKKLVEPVVGDGVMHNNGKDHRVVGAASGSSGGCREKACGANLGDGGNKGKEHIVVGAASGSSSWYREKACGANLGDGGNTKARNTVSSEPREGAVH